MLDVPNMHFIPKKTVKKVSSRLTDHSIFDRQSQQELCSNTKPAFVSIVPLIAYLHIAMWRWRRWRLTVGWGIWLRVGLPIWCIRLSIRLRVGLSVRLSGRSWCSGGRSPR
jgi:hypothetical protein